MFKHFIFLIILIRKIIEYAMKTNKSSQYVCKKTPYNIQYKFFNLKFLYCKKNLYWIRSILSIPRTNMQVHRVPSLGKNPFKLFTFYRLQKTIGRHTIDGRSSSENYEHICSPMIRGPIFWQTFYSEDLSGFYFILNCARAGMLCACVFKQFCSYRIFII